MAKLRSSSCGPLVQGMMLIALLLLPCIQASLEQAMDVIKKAGDELKEGGEQLGLGKEKVAETGVKGVNMALAELGKKDGWKEFSTGARKGIKFHKYWCKAQGWMYKLGGSNFVDDALATDLGQFGNLALRLGTFSYELTSEAGFDVCWSKDEVAGTRATTTLIYRYPNDGRYYVRMTGIRVGGLSQELVVQTWTGLNLPPPSDLYLSTAQPYTYIESSLYGSLRAAVVDQMNMLNPGAPPSVIPDADNLCYDAALRRPHVAIVLQTMELGGAPDGTAWYRDSYSSKICLGILPATTVQPPVLGTMIQSGKTMTIDLTAARGQGTLTFTT